MFFPRTENFEILRNIFALSSSQTGAELLKESFSVRGDIVKINPSPCRKFASTVDYLLSYKIVNDDFLRSLEK